jgi:hypothetical protein
MLARRYVDGIPAALAVLALSVGGAGAEPSPGADHELDLFWSDHYELLPKNLPVWGRESLQKHIEELFGEVSVRVRWLEEAPGSERTSGPLAVRIVLIPLSGEGWRLPRNAMGAVMDRRHRTRSLYVFLPSVLRSIGDETGTRRMARDPRRIRNLARALARVVTHEVVHAIDPQIPHATTDSIMSAHLTHQMLRREVLGFDAGTSEQLLLALVRTSRGAVQTELRR